VGGRPGDYRRRLGAKLIEKKGNAVKNRVVD